MIGCVTSFSQTIRSKTDQLKKDPKTIENASKTDAGLINHKNITDSNFVKTPVIKRSKTDCRLKRKNKIMHTSL